MNRIILALLAFAAVQSAYADVALTPTVGTGGTTGTSPTTPTAVLTGTTTPVTTTGTSSSTGTGTSTGTSNSTTGTSTDCTTSTAGCSSTTGATTGSLPVCVDAQINQPKYDLIQRGWSLAQVDALMMCAHNSTKTTDTWGRSWTYATWGSTNRSIMVKIYDASNVVEEKIGYGLTQPIAPTPGVAVYDTLAQVAYFPVVALIDGNALVGYLYDVRAMLANNGRFSLLDYSVADSTTKGWSASTPTYNLSAYMPASYDVTAKILSVPKIQWNTRYRYGWMLQITDDGKWSEL